MLRLMAHSTRYHLQNVDGCRDVTGLHRSRNGAGATFSYYTRRNCILLSCLSGFCRYTIYVYVLFKMFTCIHVYLTMFNQTNREKTLFCFVLVRLTLLDNYN